MRHGSQEIKIVPLIKAQAAPVSEADFTSASVDTLGWGEVTVVFHLGVTDTAMTVLKLVESVDDSNWTDVTGGSYSSSLPTATDDGKQWAWRLQTSDHARYLSIVGTADTADPGDPEGEPPVAADLGVTASAYAILSVPQQSPDTAAQRGFDYEAVV